MKSLIFSFVSLFNSQPIDNASDSGGSSIQCVHIKDFPIHLLLLLTFPDKLLSSWSILGQPLSEAKQSCKSLPKLLLLSLK